MSTFTKRVLTDERRDFNLASESNTYGTPDDLRARLRNVGSRVRKSVTEGYLTTPSTFSKAQSTGTIFQSSGDTLREVYSKRPFQPTPSEASLLKRTRDSGYHSDGYEEEDEENAEMNEAPSASSPAADVASRPIKALRKPRKTPLSTRSLPNGQLSFEPTGMDQPMAGVEEEDWSLDGLGSASSFPTISAIDPEESILQLTGS